MLLCNTLRIVDCVMLFTVYPRDTQWTADGFLCVSSLVWLSQAVGACITEAQGGVRGAAMTLS